MSLHQPNNRGRPWPAWPLMRKSPHSQVMVKVLRGFVTQRNSGLIKGVINCYYAVKTVFRKAPQYWPGGRISLSLVFGLLGFPPVWERQVRQTTLCTCSCGSSHRRVKGTSRILRSSSNGRFYSLLNSAVSRNHLVPPNSSSPWVTEWIKNCTWVPFISHQKQLDAVWFFSSFLPCFCPLNQYLKTMQWARQFCFSFGLPFRLPCPCLWWWPVNHSLPPSIFK